MSDVYALLVGINDYPPPIPPLKGCVKDIEDARQYLHETIGSRASVRTLLDRRATRDAVIEGFRRHLAEAGPGDTALFWYSGHGSRMEVPARWWQLEPDGTTMQTLVCVDSRGQGSPRDLLDQELAVLIREVANRGVHVAVVLDCCHAGSATRTPPAVRSRQVNPSTTPPDRRLFLTPVTATGTDNHVVLAACQSHELARELPDPQGQWRGVFTRGLLTELRQPGVPRTYRDLVAETRVHVENVIDRQTPSLFPPSSSIVDQPFLGGVARPPATTMTIRDVRGRWILDAGSCHGFPAASGADLMRVAVAGSDPVREAAVVTVGPDHSVVEPVDWRPEAGRHYPVVVSHVALPRTTVTVGGGPGDDPHAARDIEAMIRAARPGGAPSPHLRLVAWTSEHEVAELLVRTPVGCSPVITTADGRRLDGPGRPGGGVVAIVRTLEHIARWRQIRRLRNRTSRLADLVRVEVIRPLAHELRTPRDRDGMGRLIDLEYSYGRDGFTPPSVFVRLDNRSDRPLHCVLLDLTDRFRIHASLFPGAFLPPGASAAAADGDLIEISLPPGRAATPGARVRDWLMLVVSEDKINSDHFVLPRIGEPPIDRSQRALGLVGVVERLALVARDRDAERKPAAARDWWTSVTKIVTRVPGDPGSRP